MADWGNVNLNELLDALGRIAVPDIEGKHTFNLVVYENGEPSERRWVTVENGKVTHGEGSSDDPAAVPFEVKKGGMETLRALQVDGLNAAMRLMFDGSVFTTNPAGAQKWFKLFEIGEEAIEKALEG